MLVWRGEIRVTQRKRERHGGVLDRWRIGEGVGFVLEDGGPKGCACMCVFIERNNRKWVHVVSLRICIKHEEHFLQYSTSFDVIIR